MFLKNSAMILIMNNDSNLGPRLYWTCTLKSMCPKTKMLSMDLFGNRFRDRSVNICKTNTKSKIPQLKSVKMMFFTQAYQGTGEGLLLYLKQIQFSLWFVILLSQPTVKRKIFLPRVKSCRKVLAIFEVLVTPKSLLFYILFC